MEILTNERRLRAQSTTVVAAVLVTLLSIAIVSAQKWFHVPLESLTSPGHLLSLVVGLAVAFSSIAASRKFSRPNPPLLLTASSIWFFCLAQLHFALDAGDFDRFDLALSIAWLAPGLLLAKFGSFGKASTRTYFLIGSGVQVIEFLRCMLVVTAYGANSHPEHLQWLESISEVTVRTFYTAGFLEMLAAQEVAGRVPTDTAYGRFLKLRREFGRSSRIGRTCGIASASVKFALFRTKNPNARFSDYYAHVVTRRLDRGRRHPTLGKSGLHSARVLSPAQPADGVKQLERGRNVLELLIDQGLAPTHLCVDYGCGSLRIGRHLISYLNDGRYWGVDVTDRFYKDGLELLPPGLADSKRPHLRVISQSSLFEIRANRPDFVLCNAVLQHVPPSEIDELFRRLMGLMAAKTVLAVSFVEAAQGYRRAAKGWIHDAASVEETIRRHTPNAEMRFHRRLKTNGLLRTFAIVRGSQS